MNTPAHAVLNLLLLGRRDAEGAAGWIAAGAVAPDLPAVVFYGWEKLALARPERLIWGHDYFAPGWQALFDAVHSIPLLTAAGLVASVARRPHLLLCLASMELHAVEDLPLHGDDAHRTSSPSPPGASSARSPTGTRTAGAPWLALSSWRWCSSARCSSGAVSAAARRARSSPRQR